MNRIAVAGAEEPDYAEEVLDEIRRTISADDKHLEEARARLSLVLDAALTFRGVCGTFRSGSLAHLTVNTPVNDGDGGAVLDRRTHTTLGPDSEMGQGPEVIIDQVRKHVMTIVRETYPEARSRLTKRAILIRFNQPNADDIDPSVDLIVALTRKDADGVWIPNVQAGLWDASHPERHTELVTAGPAALRRHRARLVRLAKAAIKDDAQRVMIPFNITALALEHITVVRTLVEGLEHFLAQAASSIRAGLTEDPAKVSGKIKLPEGVTRETASKRLAYFSRQIKIAHDHRDDRATVESALAELYPDQLPDASRSAKADVAEDVRSGDPSRIRSRFRIASSVAVPSARSYGDAAE